MSNDKGNGLNETHPMAFTDMVRALLRGRPDDELIRMLTDECEARSKTAFEESLKATGTARRDIAEVGNLWSNRARFWRTRRSKKPGGQRNKEPRFEHTGDGYEA